jgi:broad specificity phosphatase PhoE
VSTIYLVRHGQAGFGQDEYDVLSELGTRQGAVLGRHFASQGIKLDALYVGPRRRHALTAQAMSQGAQLHGGALPAGQELPGFDEFPFQDILRAAEPLLAAEAAELRARLGGGDPLRDRRSFDRLFMRAMAYWINGELAGLLHESFAEFVSRVRAALYHIMSTHGRGKQVAIVTSAGPMAAALQLGLGFADPMVLKMCTVLANTALAELRYRDDAADLTVVSFNTVPHLSPDLVTYR